MHPDLELLVQAYDAASEASPQESPRLREQFEKYLQEVLSRTRGISEEALRNVIRLQHGRWLAAQRKPTAVPPKA